MLLKPLIDLHGEPKNWATAAPLYIQALADIPAELLASAVKHAIASNPYFPKPADLRLSIAHELQSYRWKQEHERQLALPPPPERQRPSPDDIEYVEKLVAPMRASIYRRRAYMRAEDE